MVFKGGHNVPPGRRSSKKAWPILLTNLTMFYASRRRDACQLRCEKPFYKHSSWIIDPSLWKDSSWTTHFLNYSTWQTNDHPVVTLLFDINGIPIQRSALQTARWCCDGLTRPLIIADIFMEDLEDKTFATYDATPRVWYRFVDDVRISVVKKHNVQGLLQQMNKQHGRI